VRRPADLLAFGNHWNREEGMRRFALMTAFGSLAAGALALD
jgi:hypothetical protein